jgi:hypothetical protein
MRIPDGLVRINRQGDDLHIETQNVAPPDSRIELIAGPPTGMPAERLVELRLSSGVTLPRFLKMVNDDENSIPSDITA